MKQNLQLRTLMISVIFGVLFFLINIFSKHETSTLGLLGKSVLAAFVFALLYYTLFTLLNTPERKFKFGVTIPIAMLLGIIIGAIVATIKIGIIVGLIVGIIAGYVWEFIAKQRGNGGK